MERWRRLRKVYSDVTKTEAGPTSASKPGLDSNSTLSDTSTSPGPPEHHMVGACHVQNTP